MKCTACGYEKIGYGISVNGNYYDRDPDKKCFIKIHGSFKCKEDVLMGDKYDVELYACPICKTVKMEHV